MMFCPDCCLIVCSLSLQWHLIAWPIAALVFVHRELLFILLWKTSHRSVDVNPWYDPSGCGVTLGINVCLYSFGAPVVPDGNIRCDFVEKMSVLLLSLGHVQSGRTIQSNRP